MSTHATKTKALNYSFAGVRHALRSGAGKTSSRDILEQVVAGYIDSAMAARQAHWIMRGYSFASWHDTFHNLFSSLDRQADAIAERLVRLGSTPPGTIQVLATKTGMSPFPSDVRDEKALTEALIVRLGQLAILTRRAIVEFERLNDPVTSHHLTEAAAVVEKNHWTLESRRRRA